MALPNSIEMPHFEKISFRVGRKIFATVSEAENTATFKLSLFEQAAFCSADMSSVSTVANKWGLQGWTSVDLSKVAEDLLYEIMFAAFNQVVGPSGKIRYADFHKP